MRAAAIVMPPSRPRTEGGCMDLVAVAIAVAVFAVLLLTIEALDRV
jgi:hypothetical protein